MVGGLVDYLLIPLRIGKQGDSCKWNSHAGSVYKPASFNTEANMEENMNFGQALDALKYGNKVARRGWNGKGMWLGLQEPDENSKMNLPYIYMKTVGGALVPWLASQTDVLAEDWVHA